MRSYQETEIGTLVTIKTGEMYVTTSSGAQKWLEAGHYYRKYEKGGMTMTRARDEKDKNWVATSEKLLNTPLPMSEIRFDEDAQRAYFLWQGQLYAIDAIVEFQAHNVVRNGKFIGDKRDRSMAAEYAGISVDEVRYGSECKV